MNRQLNRFYEFGPFRVDAANRLLLRHGEVVPLPPKAFDILLTLVEDNGQVLQKEELMQRVWPDSFVEEANLSNQIFTLRKALGKNNGDNYIKTIPRRGYRFVGEVTETSTEGTDIVLTERTRSRVVIEEETEVVDSNDRAVTASVKPVTAVPGGQPLQRRLQSRRLILLSGLVVLGMGCAGLYVSSRANRTTVLPPMKTIPLTTFPDIESNPAPSPDGKFVAFSWYGGSTGSSSIYVKQIDAGTPLRLTAKPGLAGRPRWSPDGRYVAYLYVSEDSGHSIIMIPAFGGPERKLYSAKTGLLSGLDWSPDGKTLAFTLRDSVDQPLSIYLLTIDSLEVHRLTSPDNGSAGDFYPAFSPDGKMLAFMRGLDYSETTDLHLVSVDGGEPRRITFDKAKIEGLAWTPEGENLIFSSKRSGLHRLWSIPVSGGEPQPLTVGTENAYDPSISRTGNRLTYTQKYYDTNIWLMKRATASEPPVAPVKLISSTLRDENPCLSADGRKIVFETRRSGSHELWVADSDGTNPSQLTSFGAGETCNARWSPDGRQIAFESHSEAYPNIYVINAEGGSPRRITDGPLNNCIPSWSKDGRWIYFASNRSGTWQVWRVQAEGGEPLQVTTNGGYEAVESGDGQFLYYNKFGYETIGIFRMPVQGGDETFVFDFIQLESTGDWYLANDGIYFIQRYDSLKLSAPMAIRFFDFATRRKTTVVALDRDPGSNPGLSVSADGQSFILSKIDNLNWDIMLVENFH